RQSLITRQRLVLHSFMEDGEYARAQFALVAKRIVPVFAASFRAARGLGDIEHSGPSAENAFWFAEHVAAHIALTRLTGVGVVASRGSIETVIDEAVRFILRGIGLSEAAIKRNLTPRALSGLPGAVPIMARGAARRELSPVERA